MNSIINCCKHESFRVIDDCFLVCTQCGIQQDEIEGVVESNEFEREKKGKSQFLYSTSSIINYTQPTVEMTLPYEARTRFTLGTGEADEETKIEQQKIRILKKIEEEALQKLIDPLTLFHAPNIVYQIRNVALHMLYELLKNNDEFIKTSSSNSSSNNETQQEQEIQQQEIEQVQELEQEDENEEEDSKPKRKKYKKHRINPIMKNRGAPKNAIYAHVIKRIIIHFIPEYNEKLYNDTILIPFFRGLKYKLILNHIQNYGVPIFRKTFPEFDRNFENDYHNFLKCKIRLVFQKIISDGLYKNILKENQNFLDLFNFFGNLIFHPVVNNNLQSWNFLTRVGVILSYPDIAITNPIEIVDILLLYDDNCVQASTITNKLRDPIVKNLIHSTLQNSSEKWKILFKNFHECKKNPLYFI